MRIARAVLAVLCLGATGAEAACPDWLIADMVARGVPAHEITRLCGAPPARSLGAPPTADLAPAARPQGQQQSNRCVAVTGAACTTQSPRLVGSPCWCALPGGPQEGTIR